MTSKFERSRRFNSKLIFIIPNEFFIKSLNQKFRNSEKFHVDLNGLVIRNSWLRTWTDIVHFSGSNNGQSRSGKVQNKVDLNQADHIGLNNV